MRTHLFLCVTLILTYVIGSEAIPVGLTLDKKALVSFLLQAPPVAEAACYVRDVNSVGILVNKICECDGYRASCDVGPIKVGDIEMTFCNKKPSQPVEDLLVMKFACNSSDPTCGEGTACDIGPISYDNNEYYLCLYQTTIVPPAEGNGICQPTNQPEEPTSTTPSISTRLSTETPPITKVPETPGNTWPQTVTNNVKTTATTRLPWRPWNPPTWNWPPQWRPPYPPQPLPTLPPKPPTIPSLWPPTWSGHHHWWSRPDCGYGRGWESERWDSGYRSRWDRDDSRSGIGLRRRGPGYDGMRRWQPRARRFLSSDGSSSSDGW